jgi:hypothetical protein
MCVSVVGARDFTAQGHAMLHSIKAANEPEIARLAASPSAMLVAVVPGIAVCRVMHTLCSECAVTLTC